MKPYKKSLNDVKEGRIYEYDSLNDFINEIDNQQTRFRLIP